VRWRQIAPSLRVFGATSPPLDVEGMGAQIAVLLGRRRVRRTATRAS